MINKYWGGKHPEMHDTTLAISDLGPYNVPGHLHIGDTQTFCYGPSDLGPYYLLELEREDGQQTKTTEEIFV